MMWTRRRFEWAFGFIVCTAIGLSGASTYYFNSLRNNRPIPWKIAFLDVLPDWYIIAGLLPLVLWLGRCFRLDRPHWPRRLPLHMGASMLFSVTEFAISVPIMWLVYKGPQNFSTYMANNISHYFLASFRVGILIYWVILAFGHALDYYYEFQGERARAGQLAAQLAQAELHALKMQLHPHFLFNTLHSISALLHEDIDAADQMIECLGNFLRLTLSNAGLQEVSLRQEMEFIRCYLEIEQIRFQDRLTVRMDIDPQTLDAQVPNLLWQPIVENAIKHGIEPQAAPGGCIEIGVHRYKDLLRLYVQDNGPGLPGVSSGECSFREGIGLSNTRARLQQLYGASYRFELTNAAQGGVLVLLEIPFKTASPDKIERIGLRS